MLHHFEVADWLVDIDFIAEDTKTGIHLLPSFEPFRITDEQSMKLAEKGNRLFCITIDNTLRTVPKERRQRIRVFDTGNGDTVVDRLDDGGYQYIIRNVYNHDCALLITNADFTECRCALAGSEDMRRFGLNNALMLAYAFAGSFRDTVLIHASLVRKDGYGYAFIAKSGTGKSTQVANWLRTIPGCDLMNDDNPVVRVIKEADGNSKVFIYGSPWSGKTPCYRKVKARLGAVTHIDRAPDNSVERLAPLAAFGTFLPSCSAMKWEEAIYSRICDTVTAVISHIPIYILHCTAHPESAKVCYKAIHHTGN